MHGGTLSTAPGVEPRTPRVAWRWFAFAVLLLAFIVLPFVALEDAMNAFVPRALERAGSTGMVTLAVTMLLLADIVLPVPSSFVLASAGYLLGGILGAAVCFVGLTCASLAGYAIGRYAGAPIAERLVGPEPMRRFAALSARYGDSPLLALRAVPVLAEATTILAGTARIAPARFVLLVSIGNAVVAMLYAGIGALASGPASLVFASLAAMLVPLLAMLAARRIVRAASA